MRALYRYYFLDKTSGRIKRTKKMNPVIERQERYIIQSIEKVNDTCELHVFTMVPNYKSENWICNNEQSKKSSLIAKEMLKLPKNKM